MAKKAKKTAKVTKTKRGGRKPGAWTLLTPEKLRAWRETNGVSRAALAGTLGVSSTSVQNWETGGAVATVKMQQKLAEITQGPPAQAARPSGRRAGPAVGASHASKDGDSTLVQAIASIVVEAIRSSSSGRKGVSPSELAVLIRTVRDSLS